MVRILTIILGAAIGLGIGLAVDWPIIATLVGAVLGYAGSAPYGSGLTLGEKRHLREGTDAALVVFWIVGPALQMLSERRANRYTLYEEMILSPLIPAEMREDLVNEEELIALFRASIAAGTTPYRALQRHNRRFQPTRFRKETPTYVMLREAARILVEAGAVEETVDWFLHCAAQLKVKPEVAMAYMISALEEQRRDPTMLPGMRQPSDPIVAVGQGLSRPAGLDEEYKTFAIYREQVLTFMFGSDEAVA